MSGNCGKTEYLNILNEALEELEPFVIGQGPLAEIIESFAVFIRRFLPVCGVGDICLSPKYPGPGDGGLCKRKDPAGGGGR